MISPDFHSIYIDLRTQLLRIHSQRHFLRVLQTVVYLFVVAWLLFVLLAPFVMGQISLLGSYHLGQIVLVAFVLFVPVQYLFVWLQNKFTRNEQRAMEEMLRSLFPQVRCNFSVSPDFKALARSRFFDVNFYETTQPVSSFGRLVFPLAEGRKLLLDDVGVVTDGAARWLKNPLTAYPTMLYRYALKPLMGRRVDASSFSFRGMFAQYPLQKDFKECVLILPDHIERHIGYLAKSVQSLSRHYNASLITLEDPEFERFFSVYTTDELFARALLTPLMMQRITELRKTFDRDLYLSFNRGCFYYAAENKNGFLNLSGKALNDESLPFHLYEEIRQTLEVVDKLRLR